MSEVKKKIIKTEDGKFKCIFCDFVSSNPFSVIRHMAEHTSKKPTETNSKVVSGNGIEILPVKAEDYIPKQVPDYIQLHDELNIYEKFLENQIPILLRGPKGTGKTLSIAYFAAKKGIPIIQFDCSENTKRFDLIGRFILKGDEVKYLLGALPTAIEIANQAGRAILVLEELNALTPQMQKVLNQILDWRRHIYIPEIGKTYELKNGAKLLICATMNPSTYGGVFELNEDLKSRFTELYVNYPKREKEKQIISLTGLDENLQTWLLALAEETRAGVAKGELSYALSPRDLIMFGEVYRALGDLKQTLFLTVVNRYEDTQERKTVIARIEAIFGIQLIDFEERQEEQKEEQ